MDHTPTASAAKNFYRNAPRSKELTGGKDPKMTFTDEPDLKGATVQGKWKQEKKTSPVKTLKLCKNFGCGPYNCKGLALTTVGKTREINTQLARSTPSNLFVKNNNFVH